ncbi:odorant receptor 131-2-like [Engraulis encrasicolus]|uniref:odorant receptor 131-2-like n=1 Tax=Engraulis encrasicolus TaxID=184585 RepID=UPI002FD21F89
MAPCAFCLYLNLVMLFTLRSKEMFTETPRYILFCHLLLSDSMQMWCTFIYYILYTAPLDEATLSVIGFYCFFNYLVCRITNNYLTPLYLGLMSLERYVAICFPLRHADIANKSRTIVAVVSVWILGAVLWIVDLAAAMAFQAGQGSCTDFILSQMSVTYQVNTALTGLVFALVSVVIACIYIAIMLTARASANTKDSSSATKAHKTVLLHMVQLGLCMLSLLFGVIRRSLAMSGLSRVVVQEITTFLFITLNILPRCLSPLIYGLRDNILTHRESSSAIFIALA